MKTFAACALACLTATLLWSCVSDDHRLTDTTKQNTMFIDDTLESCPPAAPNPKTFRQQPRVRTDSV